MVKKKVITVLVVISVCFGCHENESQNELTYDYSRTLENLFDFFDTHAYSDSLGVYFSEIDNSGNLVSEKIFLVALSRLVYGLSYTANDNNEKLVKAKRLSDFQIQNLIATDSFGVNYSIPSIENQITDSSPVLDVWQQAYGLCGLTELYRQTSDEALLKVIHELHQGFVNRFHDPINGGFWGAYHLQGGAQSGSKTIQSLMYPITAYMANLWEADHKNRELYERYIEGNIKLLSKNAWNSDRGWVNGKFDDEWMVCQDQNAENGCFTVSPGHNFQLAALMLRTGRFDFLKKQDQEAYTNLGIQILRATMNQNIFVNNQISEGFYSEVNPISNKVLDKRKTWWQHAEAIIAFHLAGKEFAEHSKVLQAFYFSTFQDYQKGGEYFFVSEQNIPDTLELKGSIGKSAYHTVELIRFLEETEHNNHPHP